MVPLSNVGVPAGKVRRGIQGEADLADCGVDPGPCHDVGKAIAVADQVTALRQLSAKYAEHPSTLTLEAVDHRGDLLVSEDLVVPQRTQRRPDVGRLEQHPAES